MRSYEIVFLDLKIQREGGDEPRRTMQTILSSRLILWLIHCTKGDKALGFKIGLGIIEALRGEKTNIPAWICNWKAITAGPGTQAEFQVQSLLLVHVQLSLPRALLQSVHLPSITCFPKNFESQKGAPRGRNGAQQHQHMLSDVNHLQNYHYIRRLCKQWAGNTHTTLQMETKTTGSRARMMSSSSFPPGSARNVELSLQLGKEIRMLYPFWSHTSHPRLALTGKGSGGTTCRKPSTYVNKANLMHKKDMFFRSVCYTPCDLWQKMLPPKKWSHPTKVIPLNRATDLLWRKKYQTKSKQLTIGM